MRFLLLCPLALLLLVTPATRARQIKDSHFSDGLQVDPELQEIWNGLRAAEELNKKLAEKLEKAMAELSELRESERATYCPPDDDYELLGSSRGVVIKAMSH